VGSRWLDCATEGDVLTRRYSALIKGGVFCLAALVAALVVLGAASLGPFSAFFHPPVAISANGGVTQVVIRPISEGPPGIGFQRAPTTDGVRSLAAIERYIPDPLPAPLNQWFCGTGGDLTITLGNGMQVTYGPCYRPTSINHLWANMVYIDSSGTCAPRCGPGGELGP